jgi:glycosyltransferase involved in cell wall biosynthesis
VSVIIPACNAGHCLAACVDSVRRQSYDDWQAIIVDDGSTDDTPAVAARLSTGRILSVRQDNQGQGAARNNGLGLAGGEFVAFLDADDEWKPDFLRRTVGFLEAHPQAVAVSTALVVRLFDGREFVRPGPEARRNVPADGAMLEDFFSFWARHDHVRTGTVLMRKSTVDAAGYQRADLRISQDLEYWGYLATFGPWGFIPEPLWVGNSRAAAGRGGWLAKYARRRRLAPTVESWESRIRPRLAGRDLDSFRIVRGRVAAGLAHHMILGGRSDAALHAVRAYGGDMPATAVSRLLRIAAAAGGAAWWAACGLVQSKERLKALRVALARTHE